MWRLSNQPIILVFSVISSLLVRASNAQELNEFVETQLMSSLARVQLESSVAERAPFTTDGCSGGLSGGWRFMADYFPSFKEKYGETLLWEACCVAHDVAYWQGETAGGYEKRLRADEELRQCVIETGKTRRMEMSERLETPVAEVDRAFEIISDAMYWAVRAGGGPCTGLPWRWGYGWPQCVQVYNLK